MEQYLDFALIIISIALVTAIVIQNKGVGLGNLTGTDTSTIFTARRGVEKVLFYITIGLAISFFIITLVAVAI